MALNEECVNSFARSYFSLIGLTALEHCIYTGKARTENQSMRRMTAVCQGEEEGHKDKMLADDVI